MIKLFRLKFQLGRVPVWESDGERGWEEDAKFDIYIVAETRDAAIFRASESMTNSTCGNGSWQGYAKIKSVETIPASEFENFVVVANPISAAIDPRVWTLDKESNKWQWKWLQGVGQDDPVEKVCKDTGLGLGAIPMSQYEALRKKATEEKLRQERLDREREERRKKRAEAKEKKLASEEAKRIELLYNGDPDCPY